jgi:hypothetical protein
MITAFKNLFKTNIPEDNNEDDKLYLALWAIIPFISILIFIFLYLYIRTANRSMKRCGVDTNYRVIIIMLLFIFSSINLKEKKSISMRIMSVFSYIIHLIVLFFVISHFMNYCPPFDFLKGKQQSIYSSF